MANFMVWVTYTYNITAGRSGGTNGYITCKENIVTVVEFEHVQSSIVACGIWNARVCVVKITAH